jgi:hypothetical protein
MERLEEENTVAYELHFNDALILERILDIPGSRQPSNEHDT